jgi:hypothetical protein
MRRLIFIIWLAISIYLCLGGIASILINEKFEEAEESPEHKVYGTGGKEYRNLLDQEANEEYDKLMIVYPLFRIAGDTMTFLIMLMAFGTLGSVIKILLLHSLKRVPLQQINVFVLPALGGLVGLMMIVVEEILPEFKDQSGNFKFYFTAALLAGIYTEEVFAWLEQRLNALRAEKDQAPIAGADASRQSSGRVVSESARDKAKE